ncbi:MAG: hypothetical protein ACO1O6_14105 [Bacteroidota bacterium]
MKFIKLIWISVLFTSCKPGSGHFVDEGEVKNESYTSEEIGWMIEIPKDWTIVSKYKQEAQSKKGEKAMEESTGIQVDSKKMKHLISFQKNMFNQFTSTSEPFIEEYPGEYQENEKYIHEVLYQTYADQGIKVDSLSGRETIQGLKFNTFYVTVYGPAGKEIIRQIVYSRLIKGYDFSVIISYNNSEHQRTMLTAFRKSKFF